MTLRRVGGRRPPKNAPALQLGRLLTGTVPAHPKSADHFSRVREWILGGNDQFGDCGPVSVANSRLLLTAYLTGTPEIASQDDIFDLYRRSGNPDFDPNDPGGPGDAGVDMQTMLEALVAGGIGGKKALAFAKVDVSNLEECRAAIAIFGDQLLGVDLEVAQQAQTDRGLWEYSRSSEWGGHAVCAGRYSSATSGDDVDVITWAEVVGTTDSFWSHQVQEAWVVIWPEHLTTSAFIAGIDQAQLAADYEALTGRPFPVNPTPSPTPSPVPPPPAPGPAAADLALVSAVDSWAHGHHVGSNEHAAKAYLAWKAAKGL